MTTYTQEEAIEYADSHTDSLSESDVGLMLESEELNTQSLSEELHIEMPQEILSETDCGLDDGHRVSLPIQSPVAFDRTLIGECNGCQAPRFRYLHGRQP